MASHRDSSSHLASPDVPKLLTIHLVNGPNLHHIGIRQPDIYGNQSFLTFFKQLQKRHPAVQLHYYQSHHEGELIAYLYAHDQQQHAFVLNPGAYTHTSLALADALCAIKAPCIEVHISNTFAREPMRQRSLTAPHTQGAIIGLGLSGYALAVAHLLS